MKVIRQEMTPVQLSNIYSKESKAGNNYTNVTVEEMGASHKILASENMKPDELIIGVWGTAVVEYELRDASYFDYGKKIDSKGYFPVRLLGFKPSQQK